MTTCHVCHLEYVVPETLMEEDKYDEPYELEHVLDNNAYEQFVRDYWLSQGHSSNEIDAALETRRDQQRKRKRN